MKKNKIDSKISFWGVRNAYTNKDMKYRQNMF